MADQVELRQEQARVGDGEPPPKQTKSERRRRPLMIFLAILVGVLVYAIAFDETQVSLDTITSETRQQSLSRILRALAQPDLVTYETEEEIVASELAIPCGPETTGSGQLTLTPSCGSPGETVAVTGGGFEPREPVDIVFVPDSEFVITLRLVRVEADADGNIQTEITLPDRQSDEPQELRAVTQEPIGSWGNRVEVYTDSNDNGVEDDPILGDDGLYPLEVGGNADIPAVALINPANEVVQFVTTGEPFEAVAGPARGQSALPLEDLESDEIRLTSVTAADGGVQAIIQGPPGADLTGWRTAVYDGATGEGSATTLIADAIQLSPRISDTARISWDKILETVFLALIATTAGLLLAVPLSFIAARNIMRDISITVTNLALTLLAVPLGAVAGILLARLARQIVDPVSGNGLGAAAGLVISGGLAWLMVRSGVTVEETDIPTRADRVRRGLLLIGAGAVGLVALLFASRILQLGGDAIAPALGWFDFIGSFFAGIGEILEAALTIIAALATAGVFANLASRLGYVVRTRSPRSLLRVVNLVLTALGVALWFVLVAQVIDWFYRIDDTTLTIVVPAVLGGVVGLFTAWRGMAKGEVEVGLSIYYAARTVFNTLRSIEPLIMAIVFVVWVGIGPFAGALALALHTTAALAKLYSEQVESISQGPIEAVRATGANRLQSIVYAVVPQIVPPYISFTMYRWDINVRMSTILGFVGGGGIGSILQQNVNLLDYRAAAVQMLAIAIVVATMDYASSRLRERYV